MPSARFRETGSDPTLGIGGDDDDDGSSGGSSSSGGGRFASDPTGGRPSSSTDSSSSRSDGSPPTDPRPDVMDILDDDSDVFADESDVGDAVDDARQEFQTRLEDTREDLEDQFRSGLQDTRAGFTSQIDSVTGSVTDLQSNVSESFGQIGSSLQRTQQAVASIPGQIAAALEDDTDDGGNGGGIDGRIVAVGVALVAVAAFVTQE